MAVIVVGLSGCVEPAPGSIWRMTASKEAIQQYDAEIAEQARVKALYRLQQAERRELSYQNMCEGYGYQQNTPQFNQCVVAERRNYAVEREAARTREIARQAAERASQAAKRAQLAEERAEEADHRAWLTQIIQNNNRATQERINSIGSGSDCWPSFSC